MIKNSFALLLLLSSVNFTHIVDFMVLMPLGPQLMKEFSILPDQFSFLVSVYSISAAVSGIIASFFLDRFPRRNIILFFFCGFTIATWLCGLSSNYITLLLARALTGAFGGVIGSQVTASVTEVFPKEERGKALAISMSSFSVAAVLGVPLGIYFGATFGWQMPFLILGGLSVLQFLFLYKVLPPLSSHLSQDQQKNRLHVRSFGRSQFSAIGLMSSLVLSQFMVVTFVSPILVLNRGFSDKELTWVYLLGGLVTIFSSPIVGKSVDRVGRYRMMLGMIIFSLFPLSLITQWDVTDKLITLVITTMLFLSVAGRMIPAMTLITSCVPNTIRGGFMSLVAAVQQISASAAAVLTGHILVKTDQGTLLNFNQVGLIACGISLIACIFALGVKPATVDKE